MDLPEEEHEPLRTPHRDRRPVPVIVAEPLQRSLGATAAVDLLAISAVVAMRNIRGESGGCMKRLMNVADQVEKPRKII